MSRQLDSVKIELSVLLGRSKLPVQQLLRMGRGAVIPLDTRETDEVWILANDHPIAKGDVTIEGERVSVMLTSFATPQEFDSLD